jgi:hypothetical protein
MTSYRRSHIDELEEYQFADSMQQLVAKIRRPQPIGDGNDVSLRDAAIKELETRGVIDRPGPSAYNMRCTVSVVDARDANGKQPIHIEWEIRNPEGKKIGTVSQRNEIPAGSLDGAWGKAAENAAWAAVQGIIRLLPPQYVEDVAIPRK